MRDGFVALGQASQVAGAGWSGAAATRKNPSPPEERAMFTEEVFSIAWRGGIAVVIVLVALQATGLLH
jgi:hypothetical protein